MTYMKWIAVLAVAALAASAEETITAFSKTWAVRLAADWRVEKENGAEVLRIATAREPLPGPRRPNQFALTDVPGYSRATLEADVQPLGRSLMIVFGYRDSSHFDYAHLSTDTAAKMPVHNGVFHVYGGERVRISSENGPAAFSASGHWYHVRLVHDAASGAVSVTVDDKEVPALHAVDLSLGAGKMGIGSFNETARFKNVVIKTTP